MLAKFVGSFHGHSRLVSVATLLRRLGPTGAALAWMAFIFYSSSLSQDEASKPLESGTVSWLGDFRSYVAHAVLYGVLAALIQASIWGWSFGYRLRWVAVAAVLAALYGASDEYHQSFVAGRSAALVDVFVDAVGASFSAAGLWVLATLLRSRHAGGWQRPSFANSEGKAKNSLGN